MADQQFLASFGVDIDESGLTHLLIQLESTGFFIRRFCIQEFPVV